MWSNVKKETKDTILDFLKRLGRSRSSEELKDGIYEAILELESAWTNEDLYEHWRTKFPEQENRYIGYSILIHKDLGVIAFSKEQDTFESLLRNLDIDKWPASEKNKILLTYIPSAPIITGNVKCYNFHNEEQDNGQPIYKRAIAAPVNENTNKGSPN